MTALLGGNCTVAGLWGLALAEGAAAGGGGISAAATGTSPGDVVAAIGGVGAGSGFGAAVVFGVAGTEVIFSDAPGCGAFLIVVG